MKKVLMWIGIIIGSLIILTIIISYILSGSFSSRNSSESFNASVPSSSELSSLSPTSSSSLSDALSKSSSSSTSSSEKRVIKGGQLSLVVKDVEQSTEQVKDAAKTFNGELVSSYQTNPDNPTTTITIKVPVDKFEDAIKALRQIAVTVSSESINLDDVTQQYQDYQAQLKNLQATEAQYQTIMKKATTITDILAIQEKLSAVRGQIEQLQTQIQYLERQTDMSTITLYLATDAESLPVLTSSSKWKPVSVFKSALRSLLSFLKAMSYLLIWLVVFAIIWVPLIFIIRYYRKRRQKNNLAKSLPN